MSVIVYRAKSYKEDGELVSLSHKVFPDGQVVTEKKYQDNSYCRIVRYYDRGDLVTETTTVYSDGEKATTKKYSCGIESTLREWVEDGDIIANEYYCNRYGDSAISTFKNGLLHSFNNEAAYESYDGDSEISKWYKDGVLHREDGPACVYDYDKDEVYRREYYIDGKLIETTNG